MQVTKCENCIKERKEYRVKYCIKHYKELPECKWGDCIDKAEFSGYCPDHYNFLAK